MMSLRMSRHSAPFRSPSSAANVKRATRGRVAVAAVATKTVLSEDDNNTVATRRRLCTTELPDLAPCLTHLPPLSPSEFNSSVV